jgi:hypothetical protein
VAGCAGVNVSVKLTFEPDHSLKAGQFRHDDGRVGAYLMNGTATIGSGEIGITPTTWHIGSNHFDLI